MTRPSPVIKISIFTVLALLFTLSNTFAETAKETIEKGIADIKQSYVDQGKIDDAITEFSKAISINSNDAEAYRWRGMAYAIKHNYDQAISDYTTAIGINPELAIAYNSRWVAYFHKGEYGKAWDDVHKAESLGYKIPNDLLEELKKASGREKGTNQ